jgi:hypothetical protein
LADVITLGSIGTVFKSLTHEVNANSITTMEADKIFKCFLFMISDFKN